MDEQKSELRPAEPAPTGFKPGAEPTTPLEGCFWPFITLGELIVDPTAGIKRRFATFTPERLLARAVIVFFFSSLVSLLITWGLTERNEALVLGFDKSIRHDGYWGWLLVLWFMRMVSLFAIVQMIWAGLRLIADAIRSTRRAGDDRPAWPPASKP